MDKNLLAKSTLSSLDYSLERIGISFNTRRNPQDFGGEKSQAPHPDASEGLGNSQLVGSCLPAGRLPDNQFVSLNSAPRHGEY